MNLGRYILASALTAVFIILYEWIFHGILLEPIYLSTAELWRAKEDCIFPAMMAGQVLFPFIFGLLFIKCSKQACLKEGASFGLLIGLLFIPSNLIFYAVQPLPAKLITFWSLGTTLECLLCGVIFAAVYRQKA